MEAVNFHVDIKEISECLGMVNVVKEVTKGQRVFPVFDIGCGKRPTLGILLMLEVKSINHVISIDPQLDVSLAKNINGLYKHDKTLKEFCETWSAQTNPTKLDNPLICINHGHVNKKELQLLFDKCNNYTYITNPCCVNNKLDKGLYFKDKHINSPKNEIFVFQKEV